MMCPADTPEGEACGLVKNLALLAHVTSDDEKDNERLRQICYDLGVEDVSLFSGEEINAKSTYLVFLNGLIVGKPCCSCFSLLLTPGRHPRVSYDLGRPHPHPPPRRPHGRVRQRLSQCGAEGGVHRLGRWQGLQAATGAGQWENEVDG